MARNGDGIFTRKDRPGFWISFQDASGKQKRRKVEAPSKFMANQLRSGYVTGEEKAKAFGFKPATKDSFATVVEQFLKHQKSRESAANYERERGILEGHLKPFFTGELRAIRRSDVSRYISERALKVSAATVVKECNTLKRLLAPAVEWEIIPFNPALRMSVLKGKIGKGRVRYLQPTELRALVEAAPDWLRAIIILAVFTGMRRGELLGLRWLDLDIRARRIFLPETKNGEPRTVYLNVPALAVFEALAPDRDSRALVFPGIRPEWLSVAFRRLCLSLRIQDFRFHDLRHTAASWMRMRGADIHTVALLLGHKDLRMAARYQHLAPAFLAGAVGELDGALDPGFELYPRNSPGQKALGAGSS
jgi:integrase